VPASGAARVHVLRVQDGRRLFGSVPCSGPVVVHQGRGFTVGPAGMLWAFDTESGRAVWHSPRGMFMLDRPPSVAYGHVYAVGKGGDDDTVFGFVESTGALDTRLAPSDGYHFIQGSSIVSGSLWTVEAKACLECADIDGWVYTTSIPLVPDALVAPRFPVSKFFNETGTPVVGFGHLYAPYWDSDLEHGFPLTSRATEWEALAYSTWDVSLAGHITYLGTGVGLNAATGGVMWGTGYPSASAPAIVDGVVYWSTHTTAGAGVLKTFHLPLS
jgi:outer membrane protein assembly factor BamB